MQFTSANVDIIHVPNFSSFRPKQPFKSNLSVSIHEYASEENHYPFLFRLKYRIYNEKGIHLTSMVGEKKFIITLEENEIEREKITEFVDRFLFPPFQIKWQEYTVGTFLTGNIMKIPTSKNIEDLTEVIINLLPNYPIR